MALKITTAHLQHVALQMMVIFSPTFLDSLEGVVAVNKFDRDGDLLRLQDLVV